MKPKTYQKGGGEHIRFRATAPSAGMLIAATTEGVVALIRGRQALLAELQGSFLWRHKRTLSLAFYQQSIARYLSGTARTSSYRSADQFQTRVWQALEDTLR